MYSTREVASLPHFLPYSERHSTTQVSQREQTQLLVKEATTDTTRATTYRGALRWPTSSPLRYLAQRILTTKNERTQAGG